MPNINHRCHNLLNHNVTILTSVKCEFSNITFEPHNQAFTQDWENYLNADCARSWRTHLLVPMVSRYVNQLVKGAKAKKDHVHGGDGEDMSPNLELNDNFSVIPFVGHSESMHFYVIFHEEPLLKSALNACLMIQAIPSSLGMFSLEVSIIKIEAFRKASGYL